MYPKCLCYVILVLALAKSLVRAWKEMSITRNAQVVKDGLRTEVTWSEPERSGGGEIIQGLMLQIKELRVGLKVSGSQ